MYEICNILIEIVIFVEHDFKNNTLCNILCSILITECIRTPDYTKNRNCIKLNYIYIYKLKIKINFK